MELNPGYALITTDEYKELIETSFYQEEIIHENEKIKVPIKDVIEFIRLKKTALLEKEENHE